MKSKNAATSAIALVLFIAFVAYSGVYAYRFLKGGTVTAQAVSATVSIGGIASGIIVREEITLQNTEKYIDIAVSEGSKVAAGQTIATVMTSEEGLSHANRKRELELEIARAQNALRLSSEQSDLVRRDTLLDSAVLNLSAASARHDTGALGACIDDMRTLAFRESLSPYTEESLEAMRLELAAIEQGDFADCVPISSGKSGVFSRHVDGYEHLSFAGLSGLTPDGLRALISSQQPVFESSFGKLITSHNWYFAAVMNSSDAQGLCVGAKANLNFGRYYSGAIEASVLSVSSPVNDEVCVVFKCNSALQDLLSLRRVAANVVFEQHEGIRLPTDAIRTDEATGENYIWTITAMRLERKDVSVKYREENFCIVENRSDDTAVRVGDTVVVSGRDLYEGKIIG